MQTEPLYHNVVTQTLLPVECDTVYDVKLQPRHYKGWTPEEFLMQGKKVQNSALVLARSRAMVMSKCIRGDGLKPSKLPEEFDTDFQHEVYWRRPSPCGISAPDPEIAEEPA